jgi:hypothetical protein
MPSVHSTAASVDSTPSPSHEDLDSDSPGHWGHLLSLFKHDNVLRLLLQNPNGLDAKTHYRKLELIAKNMAAYQIDICCLPETNIDWKKLIALKECHASLRNHLRHHRLITSSSSATARHAYLPGGTATIASNNWTGRISEAGSDP